MKNRGYISASISLIVFMSSCSGVRNCRAPELNLPPTVMASHYDSTTIADMDWWEFYSDSTLCGIIDETLAHNKDILSAAMRVEQMRSLYGINKADFLPELKAGVYGNNETSDYYGENHLNDTEYGLKATLSWEIDLWGNLRWAKRKGAARYLESVEAERAMRMTLISQVAEAYFRLVALDNELSIVQRTLITRMEGVQQAKLRYEGGLTSEIVYQQAQVEYATTAALIPGLEKEIQTTSNAISILMGRYPREIIQHSRITEEPILSDSISIGLPSTLLQRRPDIKASEYELKAAMASVGIAYADRFPHFNISVTGGWENDGLDNFFRSPFSYIAGNITGPIFDFGRKKKKYQAALAAYDEARIRYEQKVLEAFKETNDAVITYRKAQKAASLKAELRDASRKYVDLALLQYRAGSINYINVLDAQRRYFEAQIGMSNAIRDEHIALVRLYKALGGGW